MPIIIHLNLDMLQLSHSDADKMSTPHPCSVPVPDDVRGEMAIYVPCERMT